MKEDVNFLDYYGYNRVELDHVILVLSYRDIDKRYYRIPANCHFIINGEAITEDEWNDMSYDERFYHVVFDRLLKYEQLHSL